METKITLFRGINKEEYNLWKQREFSLLNNVSWWSADLKVAQIFSMYAILKIELIINKNSKVKFINTARGQNKNYKGYGNHERERDLFSISKCYLEKYIVEMNEMKGTNILPIEYLSESDVTLNPQKNVALILHSFNSETNEKMYPLEYVEKVDKQKIIEYTNQGFKIMKGYEDPLHLFKII